MSVASLILNDIRFLKISMRAIACPLMPVRRIGFGFEADHLEIFLDSRCHSNIDKQMVLSTLAQRLPDRNADMAERQKRAPESLHAALR
jgi:hypothetical protein